MHLGQMYKHVLILLSQGRHVRKDDAKAEEYFAKAKGPGSGSVRKNLNKLSSSSELIHSSYFRGKKWFN